MKVETDLETFKAEEKKEADNEEKAAQEVNSAKAGLQRALKMLDKDTEMGERKNL